MLRALAAGLALLLVAALEFQYVPGHSFLQGASQISVAALERLQSPGLLARDGIATHPDLRGTILDEITLPLHQLGGLTFQAALAIQQFLSRIAFLAGAYLLARSARFDRLFSLAIAAVAGLGVALPGTGPFFEGLSSVDPEPSATVIAIGFVMAGTGLASVGKVLLASLAAGIGFLYAPLLGAVFWFCWIAASIFHRPWRIAIRPQLVALLVFLLLAGNLAQLQPGAPQLMPTAYWFAPLSSSWRAALQLRFGGSWPPFPALAKSGAALAVLFAVYAGALQWLGERMKPGVRLLLWMTLVTALAAVVTFVLAGHAAEPWLIADLFQSSMRFTLALASVVTAMALAHEIAAHRSMRAAFPASILMVGLVLQGRLLLRTHRQQSKTQDANLEALAAWAERETWGNSLFIWMNTDRTAEPGMFRAKAIRAVYVDWEGGLESRYSEDFAIEWSRRWILLERRDMRALLDSNADYFVYPASGPLPGVKSAYRNGSYVVYDAHALGQP